MFLVTFSCALLLANIYFFAKKKYLYLFIPCMLFLPKYYALEINGTLPLITVTRVMFIVFYIYAFVNKKRHISLKTIKLAELPLQYYLLCGYFLFRIITNLYYITSHVQAAKTIFSLIFEQLFLLVAVYLLDPTKEEINTTIKSVVWSATVIFTIGIFESFTYIRPFDELYTVSRSIMNSHYVRLGFLRATATLEVPNLFSNACLFILPLTLYLYHQSHHKRYLICVFINLLAGIHSGSRAYFFSVILAMAFYFIFVLKTTTERTCFIKNAIIVGASVLLFATTLSLINSHARYYYIGTCKSLLNEVGFNFDLSEGAPNGVKGYGGNSGADYSFTGGVGSRRAQLSGIEYTLKNRPIFGFGNGAIARQEIYFNFGGQWKSVRTIDVGIVEIIMNEGIIGLIGFICLFGYLLFNKKATSNSVQSRFYYLSIFCYLVSTLSSINMVTFLFLFALYPQIKSETD